MNECKTVVTLYLFVFNFVFVLSTVSIAQKKAPVCPMGDEWEYSEEYSDEFNGKGLDDTKWWDFNPSWHGRKPGYFARENVAVKDGMLQLTAKNLKPEEVSIENKVRGHDKFTTSTIKSKKRIKYGYFEARCKSMNAGVCNAFWLYDPLDYPAQYKEGNHSEEIDIFEIFGNPTDTAYDRVYFATVHRSKTPYVESLVHIGQTPMPKKSKMLRMPFEFHEDYHVYGFLWTPTEMRWYVDGKEVHFRDNDYFTTALHIMFDCEIMENWVGLPDPKDLPDTYFIDYLRVWRNPAHPIPDAEGF